MDYRFFEQLTVAEAEAYLATFLEEERKRIPTEWWDRPASRLRLLLGGGSFDCRLEAKEQSADCSTLARAVTLAELLLPAVATVA